MTLIVGIICKDGIVLAADSQTTKGTAKHLGTNKISIVEFENGKALVAESGSTSLSVSAIQLFQRKASGKTVKDDSTIAKTAEEAVRQIRNDLTSLHPNSTSPDEWQNFFYKELNYFELMVAYYFDGKPFLCTLNPLWCIPVPATSYFVTSGIASDLANYILQEHTELGMDSEFASVIAIKVIEDAIEYVEGCGSPPRVALIRAPIQVPQVARLPGSPPSPGLPHYYTDPVVVFPQKKVEQIAKKIADVELQIKSTQNKRIHTALRKQTEDEYREIMRELRRS